MWRTLTDYWLGTRHCIPIQDSIRHFESPDCWCEPECSECGTWLHNAADGRLDYEDGTRLVH